MSNIKDAGDMSVKISWVFLKKTFLQGGRGGTLASEDAVV